MACWMDPKFVNWNAGEAEETVNVDCRTEFKSDKYQDVEGLQGHLRTKTGLLLIANFVPKDDYVNMPSFDFRWDQERRDGKVHKYRDRKQTLDIDIIGVSSDEKRKFINYEDGNSGHHSATEINDGKRIAKVDIHYKGEHLLKCEITFSFKHKLTLAEHLNPR